MVLHVEHTSYIVLPFSCSEPPLCLHPCNVSVLFFNCLRFRSVPSHQQINLVDLLSDAMYSDSRMVIDALAELIEHQDRSQNNSWNNTNCDGTDTNPVAPRMTISEERMTQVRYIMQVDEASFRNNISVEQLVLIESKEMACILEELVSAIGLQRFRFMDRQANGTHFLSSKPLYRV